MLHVIAATINGKEYLLTTPSFNIIAFGDLQKAKNQFLYIYHFLQNEPPTSRQFQQSTYLLVCSQPTILKINTNQQNLASELLKWTSKAASVRSTIPIIPQPHVLIPMRKGFIQRHEAVNIQKDIEASPRIGKDGQITYTQFNLNPAGEKKPQERVIDFLKQRGIS